MRTKDLAKNIVMWASSHSWRESIALSPEPRFLVSWEHLLNFIRDQTGIPEEQIAQWVDEAQE